MYLRKYKRTKGDYYAIVESVYNAEKHKITQVVIQNLGYFNELEHNLDYYREMTRKMSEEKKAKREETITINLNEQINTDENNLFNVGYCVFRRIYQDLELDKFWRTVAERDNSEYDLNRIFRLLVIARIMFPESKKSTYEHMGQFFEGVGDFAIEDVYRALTQIAKNSQALQKWIYEKSGLLYQRDLSTLYFDCTNYYFDIGRSDDDIVLSDGTVEKALVKRGPEKNHRPDPIVEMGLLTDKNGIPLAFDIFPGNESEKLHMRPLFTRFKRDFSRSRIIMVADRGLNTSDNIYYLNGDNRREHNPYDGYVYGMSVRGADAEFKNWVLQDGYVTEIVEDDDGEVIFKHKSRIAAKTIHLTVPNKKAKKAVLIDQKQMVYYSDKYAQKQRHDREMMISRAKDMIANPTHYTKATAAGSASYINNISFNSETGEIANAKVLSLNEDKIHEEEKFDGYYSIVTSELNMTDSEMRNIYRGLIQIEDVFIISKTEFKARPVYVKTNEHINAHFVTCFTALVFIRLLQRNLNMEFPVGQILESLRKYNCVAISSNRYQFVYYDEIIKKISEKVGADLSIKYHTRDEIRRIVRY